MRVVQTFTWAHRRGEGAEFVYCAKRGRRIVRLDSVSASLGPHDVAFLFDIVIDFSYASSLHPSGNHYLRSGVYRLQEKPVEENSLHIRTDETRPYVVRVSDDYVILL